MYFCDAILLCRVYKTMSGNIHHSGVVERIEAGVIYVRIVQQSACAGCHAKSMCNAAESKEKIIEVEDHSNAYRIGEDVSVCGQASLGLKAVFLAFVVPLFIILLSLIIGTELQLRETTAGLVSLLPLIPYYYIIYRMRGRLKKRFVFRLEKI